MPATNPMPRQGPNNARGAGGRSVRVPLGVSTVRAVLRRHIREEHCRMQDLMVPWHCERQTVYDIFHDGRPLSPQHVEAAIGWLGLDEFDANELRLLGASEAGWKLDPAFLAVVLEGGVHGPGDLAARRAEQLALRQDSARLSALQEHCWALEPVALPVAGGDDADIGWRVTNFHCAAPERRTVAEVVEDDPRAALDAARRALQAAPA